MMAAQALTNMDTPSAQQCVPSWPGHFITADGTTERLVFGVVMRGIVNNRQSVEMN